VHIANCHRIIHIFGWDQTEERIAEYKTALDKALELQPDLPEALAQLAAFYYSAIKDYDRALEIFNRVIKSRPSFPFASGGLALIKRRQGKWEESISNYKKATDLNPREPGLAYQMGLTYIHLRRYKEGRLCLDRVLSIEPDFFSAKISKVWLYLIEGKTEEAKILLNTLPKNEETDMSWLYLGMVKRNYQEVIDRLSSLSYDSYEVQDGFFYKNLALASVHYLLQEEAQLKNYAESARTELEKKVLDNPSDPRIHSALGHAYAYLGRKESAVHEGKHAVELMPVSKDAISGPAHIFFLAQIYAVIGEYENALDQLEYLMSIPAGFIVSVQSLRLEPIWDPLREHPRFQQLIEKYLEKEE
jgi:serine/threonine-protein kinase